MSVELSVEITGVDKSRGSINVTTEGITSMINGKRAERGKKPRRVEALEALAKRTGVIERGFVKDSEAASDLGVQAIPGALEMAGKTIDEIKALNVATGLADFLGVPTGSVIMSKLYGDGEYDISTDDTSAACPGFIHVLRKTYSDVSSPYGLGGPQLVVTCEPASKGINPSNETTFPIFGDGGSALVVDTVEVESPKVKAQFVHGIDTNYIYNLLVPAGGSARRVDEEAIAQNLNCIHMDGELVAKEANRRLPEMCRKVVKQAKLSFDDIDLFIPHQANYGDIIKPTGEELGLPEEKVFVNIGRYGNTSASSIPIAIREAWEQGKLKRGDLLLIATFGAGLNFGAAILPMNGLPENPDFPL